MKSGLVRRLLAEAVGTGILVLFGAGSIVAALTVGDGKLTYAGLGIVAISFAIAIAVAVYGFLPVSGSHINPAVTVALAVTGRFKWSEVIPYVVAQLIGGAAGGLLIVAMFGAKAVAFGGGATALGADVSYFQGIVAEALGTFLLMFAVMAAAVDSRMPPGWAGLIIGLAVASAIMVTGPLTGGSMNPARTFGPNLAMTFYGGTVQWGEFLLYWIGPLIGSVAAALLYDGLVRPRDAEAKPTKAHAV